MDESILDASRFDEDVLKILTGEGDDEPTVNPNKQLSFDADMPPPPPIESSQSGENIQVMLRLRPLAGDEPPAIFPKDDGSTVRAVAPQPLNQRKEYRDPREYSFTKVMDENTTQDKMYADTSAEIVRSFVTEGKSGLIFAYGVTSSGKSYTVMGDKEEPGIIPRAVDDIYQLMGEDEEIKLSLMEIYNEQIYDLLSQTKGIRGRLQTAVQGRRKNLLLGEVSGKVVVKKLTSHAPSNPEEALKLIETGIKNRTLACTNLNTQSSRSHCVCSIELKNSKDEARTLWVVDLAGSERNDRTGVSGVSKKQTEANNINVSLFTLMTCLSQLRSGNTKTVAARFRESKLTRLLGPHFAGKHAGRTVMIVNANPAESDFAETVYVMSQTAPCTKIKVAPSKRPSRQESMLAAGSKFDANGHRIRPGGGLKRTASGSSQSSSSSRRRLESSESVSSVGSSMAADAMEAMQSENRVLKQELLDLRNELEVVEMEVREECAEEMQEMVRQLEAMKEAMDHSASTAANPLLSARKRKKKEDVEKVIDNLQERCDDLEDELRESRLEVERLKAKQAVDASSAEINEEWIVTDYVMDFIRDPTSVSQEEVQELTATLHRELDASKSDLFQRLAAKLAHTVDTGATVSEIADALQELVEDTMLDESTSSSSKAEGEVLKELVQSETLEKLHASLEEVESLNAQLEEMEEALTEKEQRLEETEGSLKEQMEQFEGSQAQLNLRDEVIQSLKASLTEREAEVASLKEQIQTMAAERATRLLVSPGVENAPSSSKGLSPVKESSEASSPPQKPEPLASRDPNSPTRSTAGSKKRSAKQYSPGAVGRAQKRIREKARQHQVSVAPTPIARRTRSRVG